MHATCSVRNCCPITSCSHMKKDTRLFRTASDRKPGGDWEWGYSLLCTCQIALYPEVWRAAGRGNGSWATQAQWWCILHPAHLALFPGLGSIRQLKYDECLPTTAHSTITIVSQNLQDYGTVWWYHPTSQGRMKDRKNREYFSYLVEVLPESLEEFLSILLNHRPDCVLCQVWVP